MMELLDHYKDTYHRENERSKALQDSLSIPIGIISVLTTLLTFYLFNFDFKYKTWLSLWFLLSLATGTLFLVLAGWRIYLAYNITSINPTVSYKLLPVAEEQRIYFDSVKAYYITQGEAEDIANISANKDFQSYLQDLYIEYGSNNNDVNATIYGFITTAKRNILISLVIFLLAVVPYGINYENKPSSSTKFEIIKSVPLQLDTNTIKTLKHG